jgi:hypothetical protein
VFDLLFLELSFSLMPEALFLAFGLPRLLPQLIGALPDFFSLSVNGQLHTYVDAGK